MRHDWIHRSTNYYLFIFIGELNLVLNYYRFILSKQKNSKQS